MSVDLPAEFDLDRARAGAFLSTLAVEYESITTTNIVAYVEATADHHTPWGIVHGGYYAAVIETVASVGASYAVLSNGQFSVGVNNQTDFLRPFVEGRLNIQGTAISQGRNLQLWLIELTNTDGKLIARGQVRLFNQPRP
jgi:1,4-dihydroxy-2-naphthoyl-CoA hydrolase